MGVPIETVPQFCGPFSYGCDSETSENPFDNSFEMPLDLGYSEAGQTTEVVQANQALLGASVTSASQVQNICKSDDLSHEEYSASRSDDSPELNAKCLEYWTRPETNYIGTLEDLGIDDDKRRKLLDDFSADYWSRDMTMEGVNFAMGLDVTSPPSSGFWYEMVEEYMRRSLTKVIDKLPALSGMAITVQMAMPTNRYLAGHWRQGLELSLFWEKVPWTGSKQVVRQGEYRAPTWSWASVDGENPVSASE